jgi:lysophospholipase L1-like esterase
MKRFLVTLLAIGCIVILVIGNKHWKEKTFVAAEKTQPAVSVEAEEPKVDDDAFMKLTANWPAAASEHYQQSLEEEDQPFTILLAGSNALGKGETAWSNILKEELEEAYGETVQVIVKSYDLTSKQFIDEDKVSELLAEQPDLTLLEPFTLMDNNQVTISISHQNIAEIASRLTEQNPEHVLMLQPPNPLYNPNYYHVQVEGLQEYAEKQEIPYLNHWTAWPDTNDNEIKEYITPVDGNTVPSEKGHQVWAEFLTDYFIAN